MVDEWRNKSRIMKLKLKKCAGFLIRGKEYKMSRVIIINFIIKEKCFK